MENQSRVPEGTQEQGRRRGRLRKVTDALALVAALSLLAGCGYALTSGEEGDDLPDIPDGRGTPVSEPTPDAEDGAAYPALAEDYEEAKESLLASEGREERVQATIAKTAALAALQAYEIGFEDGVGRGEAR